MDFKEEAARAVAQTVKDAGGDALAYTIDVTDEQAIVAGLQAIVDDLGGLHAVINNAGVDVTISVKDMATADWNRVIATNLTGPFLLSKYALAHMGQGSHIVNIASTAARAPGPMPVPIMPVSGA